jgi:hypothetical protein
VSSRDVSDDDLFDAGLGAEEIAEQRAVRDLLRSLPDPGPVPPDVLDRITQTLQELQAERGGKAASGVGSPRELSGATAVPLRRPSHRVVWLAAAAALVLSGGGAVVSQLASDTSAGESAASVAARTSESGLGPPALDARLHASGIDYRQVDLVRQARALLATPPLSSAAKGDVAGGSADQGGSGQGVQRQPRAPAPLMSSDAVSACLQAMGVAATSLLTADRATYEGRPALVLVVNAGSASQVRVVSPNCRAGAVSELASVRLP